MSKKIKILIDNKECEAKEGEYILNIARRNNIFIPAICYLTGCSPTLACRLCLVEIDGKQAYACNTKAKDGMSIVTVTQNIIKERRAIMEVYDVNHPLECGVCDKSGECELQNFNLEIGVDSQSYALKDTNRPVKIWDFIHYDSSLCIVCERCVTVCKDMIGDSALKTVPRGGEKLSKELKASMPKDAYAMWNKLQKSIIGSVSGEGLDCTFCGECIAVCPVGAMTSKDFKYTSNAWELKKIPASCSHCSSACHLYYEIKHDSIKNQQPRIYRVTNEFHYQHLCGAGRFGFDFENRAEKDSKAFENAVEFFKKADTIKFTSYITNEEALILQKLKEKFGYKLINNEALNYQRFLQEYSAVSGKSLYGGDIEKIKKSDFIVVVGSRIESDNPAVRYALTISHRKRNSEIIYFHPIVSKLLQNVVTKFIKYEVGTEEGVISLLCKEFLNHIPKDIEKWMNEFDVGYVSAECSVGEEEIEEIKKRVFRKKRLRQENFTLIIGEDFYAHPNSSNLAKLVGLIDKYTDFEVVLIPPKTNSLGVSLICELDNEEGETCIGYNTKGDFVLSALGDGDLDMPALNQQEGTFTNIDKRVVPTNAALPYNGYTLNDIAKELGVSDKKWTIEWTKHLPQDKGFKSIDFDKLPNYFDNSGEEIRGYQLDTKTIPVKSVFINPIENLPEFNGTVIYRCEPVLQFSPFTNKAHQIKSEGKLYCSETFLQENSLEEGDKVEIQKENISITLEVVLDDKIENFAFVPTFDKKIEAQRLFADSYRFIEVSLKKVEK